MQGLIDKILKAIGWGEKTYIIEAKDKPEQQEQKAVDSAIKIVKAKDKPKKQDLKEIEENIRAGLRSYAEDYNQGNPVPAEDYIDDFVEAAEKYPIFRANPYLLPQIAILESSGGLNITRPNNMLNWGINYPGNNEAFSQMSVEDVLQRAISGLGERSPYYEQFRTGKPLSEEEVGGFAKTYEPANPDYAMNLLKGMQKFGGR